MDDLLGESMDLFIYARPWIMTGASAQLPKEEYEKQSEQNDLDIQATAKALRKAVAETFPVKTPERFQGSFL